MKNSYSALVIELRDSLTQQNWSKGSYFVLRNNTICMCVHGAGQKLVNPQVKIVLGNYAAAPAARVAAMAVPVRVAVIAASKLTFGPAAAAMMADAERASAVAGASVGAEEGERAAKYSRPETSLDCTEKATLQIWNGRPSYIKNDYLDYGNTSLHFLLGLFGVTSSFNDAKTTTLEMLKDKLTECANWAQANGI